MCISGRCQRTRATFAAFSAGVGAGGVWTALILAAIILIAVNLIILALFCKYKRAKGNENNGEKRDSEQNLD